MEMPGVPMGSVLRTRLLSKCQWASNSVSHPRVMSLQSLDQRGEGEIIMAGHILHASIV